MQRERQVLAGIGVTLMATGALWYVLTEAITAYAFVNYSYATNWISDLGVTTPGSYQGRAIDSPLAGVMNAGFTTAGLLTAVAGVLLFWAAPAGRRRIAILLLGLLHGAGLAVVGLVNGSQENQDAGLSGFHFGGALVAILCGNALVILLASSTLREMLPTWARKLTIGFGAFGYACLVGLIATVALPIAPIFERGTVYAFQAAALVLAGVMISKHRARDRAIDNVARG